MLAYLILAGQSGAPVDPALIARFDRDDLPELPFLSESRIVWRNQAGSVVFFGWQAFTEVAEIGSHWVVDERGITAFSGHCWPADTGWVHGTGRSWAMQLRDYLGPSPDPPAIREALFGSFTLLTLPASGTGWAMPDWMNFDQLFVSEDNDITAVSNRAALCALAVVPEGVTPQRSSTAAGWMIGTGWMIDQETGYWDVERPGPGSSVVFDPDMGASVVAPRHSPMFPPAPDDPELTYEALLDEVEQDLRAILRAIACLPVERRVFSLSGGKDSRTLTAIILSEGLQDRFQFVTTGSPERADAIAARAIAERFDLDWILEDASNRSPEDELENALLHTGLTEGMSSAWGTFSRPVYASSASVTGVVGEVLQWGKVARSAIGAQSVDQVLTGLRKARPIDPLGVLRPELRTYFQSVELGWIEQHARLGIPFVSMANLFYVEQLVHSRNGPDYAWSSRLRLSPYARPATLRSNHRIPIEQRPDFRFHLDLQRRNSIELSKMPFADATWPEAALWHLPDAEDYRRIEPAMSTGPDGRAWRQKRYGDYRPLIEAILLDRSNPIHDLLDYDRLVERVATGDANAGRTRLIWGALTAAIWLGGHERTVKLERPPSEVSPSKNPS